MSLWWKAGLSKTMETLVFPGPTGSNTAVYPLSRGLGRGCWSPSPSAEEKVQESAHSCSPSGLLLCQDVPWETRPVPVRWSWFPAVREGGGRV